MQNIMSNEQRVEKQRATSESNKDLGEIQPHQVTLRQKCSYLDLFWSAFSFGLPDAGECGPEWLRMRTLFAQCYIQFQYFFLQLKGREGHFISLFDTLNCFLWFLWMFLAFYSSMPQIDTFSGFFGPVFNQVCVLRPIANLCFNGEFDPLSLSRLWGELMGCVHSRELGARASPFEVYPVGSFSGALLVVSALGIDYDWHMQADLQS